MISFIILLSIAPAFGEITVDCSRVANGLYEVGCKSYVNCTDGVRHYRECGIGEVFDNATRGCYDELKVGPPCGSYKDCSVQPNHKYPDSNTDCHSYYTCQNGQYYGHNFCSPGTVFDESMQLCNWPRNVYPPCGTKS